MNDQAIKREVAERLGKAKWEAREDVCRHVWLYYREQLYERLDYIYRPVEDHLVERYFEHALRDQGYDPAILRRSEKLELLDHIKSANMKKIDEVARLSPPNLIAFSNGHIDISQITSTGELKLIEHEVSNMFNNKDAPIFFSRIPHAFNQDAWQRFLEWSGDGPAIPEQALQHFAPDIYSFFVDLFTEQGVALALYKIAYCFLKTNTYKVFFIEFGEKNRGKTTYLNLISHLLGSHNISNKSLQDLADKEFYTADLENKLANIYDDLKRKMIENTGLVKQLTGESTINAHRKFKSDVQFRCHAKLIFACNALPGLKDLEDDAFFSRIVLTRYTREFPPSDFAERLLNDESQMEGLIIASLVALRDILSRNVFEDNFEANKEFWRRTSSSVYSFVRTFEEQGELTLSPDAKIEKHELYSMYAESEKYPLTMNKFTMELGRLFAVAADAQVTIEGRRKWAYRGIGKPQSESDQTPQYSEQGPYVANEPIVKNVILGPQSKLATEKPNIYPEKLDIYQGKCALCGQDKTCTLFRGNSTCIDCMNAETHRHDEEI